MATCVKMSLKSNLADLGCPFNWELSSIAVAYYSSKNFTHNTRPKDEMEYESPILKFISLMVECMEGVMSADTDFAQIKFEEAKELLQDIETNKENENIIQTFEHIYYATKCYLLYENGNEEECEDVFQNMKKISDFTPVELGALEGCKALAFSNYHDFGIEKAIKAAQKALELDENNAYWYFVLGKNLRRKRRKLVIHSKPSTLEYNSFEKAHTLSKMFIFSLYYSQALYENTYGRKHSDSSAIKLEEKISSLYKHILSTNTTCVKLLLKIAIGFIRMRTCDEQENILHCLDTIDKVSPQHGTCLHYRALFYANHGQYKEALKFYKKAADQYNLIAEFSYIEYAFKIDGTDPIDQLLNILTKYKCLERERQQAVFLYIATSYHFIHKDYINAAKYFLQAINVNPESEKLSRFYKFAGFVVSTGIYNFLIRDFIPRFKKFLNVHGNKQKDDSYDTPYNTIKELEAACKEHSEKQVKDLLQPFKQLKPYAT